MDMADEQPERPDREGKRDVRTGRAAARNRMQHQARYVDLQIQQAMARGDFDNLPGAGKPIRGLGTQHDPDWWVKQLIEREKVTGVLPPALQLRKDDAELDAHLDELRTEAEVREEVEEFNARVLRARYTPVDGPPLITQTRDVDAEVTAWRARRSVPRPRPQASPEHPSRERPRKRRWFRR
jgi:hypothetical protein